MLFDLYDYNILKIDSTLSFDQFRQSVICNLEVLMQNYPGPEVIFWAFELKVVANAATWTLELNIMKQNDLLLN